MPSISLILVLISLLVLVLIVESRKTVWAVGLVRKRKK